MEKSPAPALSRGLEILELIAREGELGFNQLQDKTELNTSSLNRLLKALLAKQYIKKTKQLKYGLGLKLLALAQGNKLWQPLLSNANPVLQEISDRFGVSALLLGFSDEQFIALSKVANPYNISMLDIGAIKKDYLTSPWGYLYLSGMSDSVIDLTVKKADRNTRSIMPAEADIKRLISTARERGYADDEGLAYDRNFRRFAFPVKGMNEQMIAVLGAGSFVSLLDELKIKTLISFMSKKAAELSLLMKGK